MKEKEKVLRESFSFSKFEKVPEFDVQSFLYKEVRFMSRLSKIMISLVVVLLVVGVGVFLLYDSFVMKKEVKVSQPQEELIKTPQKTSAIVSMVYGDVKVQNADTLKDVEIGYQLSEGDIIATSSDSECEIQIPGKSLVRVKENSKVSFSEVVSAVDSSKKDNIVELLKGNVKVAVKKIGQGEEFKVKTEAAVAAVRGTIFSVSFDESKGTEVLVAEGKVAVAIRSKKIEELKEKASPELKDKLAKLENISEIVVEEGESTKVTPEIQSKIDSKLSKVIEPVLAHEKISEKDIEVLGKEVKSISKQVEISSVKVPKEVVLSIGKEVSRSLIILDSKTVKVIFLPGSEKYNSAEVFIDGIFAGKAPVNKILEQGREYLIEIKYKAKTISQKVKFDKDTTINIGKTIDVEKEALVESAKKSQDKLIETKDFGFSTSVKYSRWIGVISGALMVPTTEGLVIFQGDKIEKLGVKGLAFGYSDKYIVSISKDNEDYLVVNIYTSGGKPIDNVNLGSQSKGTLVVSSPAILGNKVFVPSIEGLWIVDISKGTKSFIKIGSVYSEVVPFGSSKVVAVNEIGEVYLISTDGEYSKIAQLSIATLRKASVSTDGSKIFIFSKGTLYIVSTGKEVMNVSTGISDDSKPILFGNRVILYGNNKVVVMDENGNVDYVLSLSGINGMPYVKDNYLVITSSDGVYVYNFKDGKKLWNYNVIGNVSFIKDGKLYVSSNDKVYVFSLE
ncbi:MAG: FecR domain-containing protein [Brevinematia bacterium]